MTFPPRDAKGWERWDEEYRARHPETPAPPPDAPPPPPDPRIPDDREEEK